MTRHIVIYIPGLGDDRPTAQKLVVGWWRLLGVQSQLFQMRWADRKPFGEKFNHLLVLLDELAGKQPNVPISLVASSAGASVALAAFDARPEHIQSVVCICGKVNHPETVRAELYRKNPAFKQSMAQLQAVLPDLTPEMRYRIMTMHPLSDNSVPPADTLIRGARTKLIFATGHAFSIALALTVYAPSIMRFIKQSGQTPADVAE